jgi:hypothetical protein
MDASEVLDAIQGFEITRPHVGQLELHLTCIQCRRVVYGIDPGDTLAGMVAVAMDHVCIVA